MQEKQQRICAQFFFAFAPCVKRSFDPIHTGEHTNPLMLLASRVNTPIGNNKFHLLTFCKCASSVNRSFRELTHRARCNTTLLQIETLRFLCIAMHCPQWSKMPTTLWSCIMMQVWCAYQLALQRTVVKKCLMDALQCIWCVNSLIVRDTYTMDSA